MQRYLCMTRCTCAHRHPDNRTSKPSEKSQHLWYRQYQVFTSVSSQIIVSQLINLITVKFMEHISIFLFAFVPTSNLLFVKGCTPVKICNNFYTASLPTYHHHQTLQKHLAKPIGTTTIINLCFVAGKRARKCRHVCCLSQGRISNWSQFLFYNQISIKNESSICGIAIEWDDDT